MASEKSTIFYAKTGLGACLVKARSEEHAEKKMLRIVGTYQGVQDVREATEKDIAWVKAMGGIIHD